VSNPPEAPEASDIDALIAAGKHAEAAAAALAAGDARRAADLYEKIWQFAPAARAARAAGDAPRAMRLALEAREPALIAELHAQLAATDDGARTAVELYARARRHGEAAELAERLGDTDKAIDYYQRAHRDLDAARLLEAAGRDREAGRLLEKAIDLVTGGDRLEARLRLGRILARRAAYADAARHLQEVRNTGGDAMRAEALRHLVAVLAAMGLRDGARDVLLELRRADPTGGNPRPAGEAVGVPTPSDSPRLVAPDAGPGDGGGVDLDSYLRAWRDTAPKTERSRDLVAGRYRLDRLLGAGGAGRVFLALDEVSGRTVAVKVMHAADARGSAAYERFLREARVALALRHPSLVEVYEVSVEHGLLVMEYMPGGSLAQRIAGGPMVAALVKRMALELIAGLEMAHHRGVVHRDIKPANVFFDARGTAKLGDFGVAHLLDLGQTQTGGLIGTLAYMSPEQITGAPLTITADLYALGVTLFEAVTGRLPFLGPDFVAQHLGEDAPAPTTVRDGLASGWDAILGGLLTKSPDERTPSITALRAQLDALDLGGRPLVLPIRDRRDSLSGAIAELVPADPATPDAPRARYQFETPLGQTALSRLVRAVDTNLDRSVVIERFDDGELADAALARARALGGASSPFVQRALSLDRATRTAVFEAPAGAPFGDLTPGALAAGDVLRMIKRLARAIASLHERGVAHGGIAATTVVVDDGAVPTLMAAGLGPPPEAATPEGDVAAVISLAAVLAQCAPTLPALARAMVPPHAAPPVLAAPADGEALYGAVDAIEIALLRAG
jgi:tRNA A-37 threonylcarbamoyl transferase component Bud32/tetratricopeptide (TPR) repeat protein